MIARLYIFFLLPAVGKEKRYRDGEREGEDVLVVKLNAKGPLNYKARFAFVV
jgi:hypothetical protein